MRRLATVIVVGVVIGASAPVLADPTVGVVVTGDETVHSTGVVTVETWLGKHNFAIGVSPLDKDAVLTLTNCLAISDIACARGVVEKRSKADTLVIIVAQPQGPAKKRDFQLSAYWMTKNHEVISLQKTCNHCTKDVVGPTLEALMSDLQKLVPAMTGKLEVSSDPQGVLVMLDNEAIGVTPVAKDIPPGSHEVALSRDGKIYDKKAVTVTAGEISKVALVAPPPPKGLGLRRPDDEEIEHKSSRTLPIAMMGVGGAAVVTGIVMYAVGGPSGDNYMYRDLRPPGIGVAIAGGVVAGLGTFLFLRAGGSSQSSGPTVSVTPSHTSVGWAGSF